MVVEDYAAVSILLCLNLWLFLCVELRSLIAVECVGGSAGIREPINRWMSLVGKGYEHKKTYNICSFFGLHHKNDYMRGHVAQVDNFLASWRFLTMLRPEEVPSRCILSKRKIESSFCRKRKVAVAPPQRLNWWHRSRSSRRLRHCWDKYTDQFDRCGGVTTYHPFSSPRWSPLIRNKYHRLLPTLTECDKPGKKVPH